MHLPVPIAASGSGRRACRALHSFLALAVVVAAGCAGTAPRAEFLHSTPAARIAAADAVQVNVTAAAAALVLAEEQARLAQKIQLRIDNRKLANQLAGDARNLELDLELLRYEKGSAFARYMLAGLGQMHIAGRVRLYQMPAHELLAEFDLTKTFAWGGMYGGSTSIEEIEDAFADGVAAAVTGDQAAKRTQKGT